jgi:hypothetical protein
VKKLIPIVLSVLVAVSAALAATYWHGSATGDASGTWQCTLYDEISPPYVDGTWYSHGQTGTFYGIAQYDSHIGCYIVTKGTWKADNANISGGWEGAFCPVPDTAQGTWWTSDNLLDGTWAGHQDH